MALMKLLSPVCNEQVFDNNGLMLTSGTITVYLAGTLQIASIYSDNIGTASTNPIVLNAAGRISTGALYLDSGRLYDIVIKKGTTTIQTYSNITGISDIVSPIAGAVQIDTFTVSGAPTATFSLSTIPTDISLTFVTKNGLVQTPNVDYTLNSNIVTLAVSASIGDKVVVRTNRALINETPSQYQRNRYYDTFTTTNAVLNYTLTKAPGTLKNLIVFKNGLALKPTTDYTWSALAPLTLTLVANPGAGAVLSATYNDVLGILTPGTTDAIYYGTTTQYLTDYLDSQNTNAAQVSSIAALRLLNKTKVKTATVVGYYAKGDGITSDYYYDSADITSVDDGGSIIVGADGGRWKLIFTDKINPRQFGAKGDGTNDAVSITTANTFAHTKKVQLVFSGGTYNCGTTSFIIDPQKTSWSSSGQVTLSWSGIPASGYSVRVVAGEATAYITGNTMNRAVMSNLAFVGGGSGTRYVGHGIQIGDGVNHTYGLVFDNIAVQGWTKNVYIKDNVWWIRFVNPRLLWGDFEIDATGTNSGEAMTIENPVIGDGSNLIIGVGDWTITGGSLDNSQMYVTGFSKVSWDSPHLENPGQTNINQYYVSIGSAEAMVNLRSVDMVTNTTGAANSVTGYPFYVPSTVTTGGLFVDGFRFTQGPHFNYKTLVSGTGRCEFKNVVPGAYSNSWYMAMATNHPGALRNAGFEEANLNGWASAITGTGSITAGNTRVKTGSYAARCDLQGGTGYIAGSISQTQACTSGKYVAVTGSFSRDLTLLNASETGVINAKIDYIDAAGNTITSNYIGGYTSAPNGTNDASFFSLTYAGIAPLGTYGVFVKIEFQRPSGTGRAIFYVDDIVLNVC